MPGQPPKIADNLLQARVSAWQTYRESQDTQPSLGTLISASDLAVDNHNFSVQTKIRAVEKRADEAERQGGLDFDTGLAKSLRSWLACTWKMKYGVQ